MFRAWYKRKKYMVTTSSVACDLSKWGYSDDYILMQFTGMLDQSGKEIYEGDIVKIANIKVWSEDFIKPMKGTSGVVKWINEGGEYWMDLIWDKNKKEASREFLRLVGDEWNQEMDEIESNNLLVIGNIYANPELVAEQKTKKKTKK